MKIRSYFSRFIREKNIDLTPKKNTWWIYTPKFQQCKHDVNRKFNFLAIISFQLADPTVKSWFRMMVAFLRVKFMYGGLGESVKNQPRRVNLIEPEQVCQNINFVDFPNMSLVFRLISRQWFYRFSTTKLRKIIPKKVLGFNGIINQKYYKIQK